MTPPCHSEYNTNVGGRINLPLKGIHGNQVLSSNFQVSTATVDRELEKYTELHMIVLVLLEKKL